MPQRVKTYFLKSGAGTQASEDTRQTDEVSVAPVSPKHPPTAFLARLCGHVFRGGGADRTKLRTGFRVLKTDAARFGVQPSPGQRQYVVAPAPCKKQRSDCSDTGTVLAASLRLAHCGAERGELVGWKKTTEFVVSKAPDAARRV